MPDILTVDYETYFDPAMGYTLSKMTTEEYVRDPRFQVIMVGVKVNDQPPTWFSGDHDATREFLGDMGYERAYVLHHNANFDGAISSWVLGLRPKLFLDTLSMARPALGMRTRLGLKHLAEWFGIGTKGDDTNWAKGLRREHFSPAQLTEYAGYCATREDSDCNLTKRLFDKLLPTTTKDELLVIDSTIRMFTEPGLYLDRGVLEQHLAATRKAKAELLSQIDADDVQKTLRSAPKLAALLESFGVTPPTKVSPATGKQAYAFAKNDKAFTDLLDHPDIRVQAVVAARLGTQSTQEEKRTERLIGIASRGMFPVPIAYAGAVTTLRDSGMESINTQNFGRTSPIRRAIIAGPGEAIVAGDLSQIELRVNHTLAGNIDKIRLFVLGEDVYVVSARETYHTDVMDITDEMLDQAADNPDLLAEYKRHKLMRFVGKVKELQLGYQSGWAKYKDTVRLWSDGKVILADEEAQQHVKQWRSVNRLVVANNWRKCQKAIEAMAKGDPAVHHIGGDSEYAPVRPIETYRDGEECGFLLPSGHKIRYYDLRYDDDLEQYTYYTYKGRRSLYGSKAVENIVQSVSRHVFMYCANQFRLHLTRQFPRWRPHPAMRVHDELVAVGPEDQAEQVAALLKACMSSPLGNPPWWPALPLASKVSWGKSYADAK
jgi:DNA polymerase